MVMKVEDAQYVRATDRAVNRYKEHHKNHIIEGRLVVDKRASADVNGRVYINTDDRSCWLYFSSVRLETKQEALEEILKGDW